MSALAERRWLRALLIALGGYYVGLGLDASGAAGVLGILGGLAIWAALLAPVGSRRLGLPLLAGASMPFAIATWWSVVTPLIGLLVLLLGSRRRLFS